MSTLVCAPALLQQRLALADGSDPSEASDVDFDCSCKSNVSGKGPSFRVDKSGAGGARTSLAAAIADARTAWQYSGDPAPATIELAAGTYRERAVLDFPCRIRAAPGSGPAPTIVWETDAPYESTVVVMAPGTSIKGVNIKHRSPSVANNFAVYVMQGASLSVAKSTVTSQTGAGLAVEGGCLEMRGVTVDSCAGVGVQCLASIEGDAEGRLAMGECVLRGNGGGGLLARGGVQVCATQVDIEGNGGPGVQVADARVLTWQDIRYNKNKGGNIKKGPGVTGL
ncbi:unnamed protein product [Pedinophyceae sp. YPF-701]|nr:unnamed protein product [Pedinophyceae sp. YPF-701]